MRPDVVSEFYERYWADPAEAAPSNDPDAPHRLRIIRQEIEPRRSLRVLDVGCGRGDLAAELLDDGHDVQGMELIRTAIDAAASQHPRLEIRCHGIENEPWPFASASFDVVLSLEVIEYLLHPAPLLRETRRVLRPGGLLFISTPFHGWVKNVALSLAKFDQHFCNLDSGHIRFYSDHRLSKLAKDFGFESIRIRHYGRKWPLWRGSLLIARRKGEGVDEQEIH